MKQRSILDETDWMEDLTKNADSMKKIIVPVDFSEVSKNAARYAAQMSADIPGSEILLYNVYQKFAHADDGTPLTNEGDATKIIAESSLNNLRFDIMPLTKSLIGILAETGNLAENLEKLVLHNGADLVIMGISGTSKMEQALIGSNTLGVVRKDSFPVLIVPPGATYERIHSVVFASDFKDVERTTPIPSLRKLLSMFRPELHVVHVEENQEVLDADKFRKEKDAMDKLLFGFNPEYSFLDYGSFSKGISKYVHDKHVNMIITVPHRHAFLKDMFRSNHTEKLVYHTHVPVLALHQ
jgi:nucleotide-binding universal stress UspA family protein